MRNIVMRKALCVLLAFLMALSASPLALAAELPTAPEETEYTVPEETTESTELLLTEPSYTEQIPEMTEKSTECTVEEVPETTEAFAEATAVTEETLCLQVTEETAGTEGAEETICTEPGETLAETLPEESVPEDTVPAETLPMLILTEDQLEKKQELADGTLLATLADLIPGEDYGQQEILVEAEDELFAQQAAEVFGGELEQYGGSVALIRLSERSVLEAVTASADMETTLPAAYPNFYYQMEPRIASRQAANGWGTAAPEKKDWSYWVQENGIDDPYLQEPESSDYQWMHDAVNTYAAWGITTGSSRVKVAVLDTGVQENHPDLSGKVTSYDIGCGTSDCSGHGTHVSGIIAASLDNGIGGAGIAPGVSILNIRVFRNANRAETYDIIQGIERAVTEGAWIINMSLGSLFLSPLEEETISDAIDSGVTVIAAMGNNGSNTIHYPAALQDVIAVSAVNSANGRAWFSNFGDWADVAAPGAGIMSTVSNSRYEKWNGTSMAAPVVSGVAALYMSVYGKVAPAQMGKVLRSCVTKLNDKTIGKGLINAEKLFAGQKETPDYWILSDDAVYYNDYKGAWLPCESELILTNPINDQTGRILYTINGAAPSVKDGIIVNGVEYTQAIDLSWYPGETVTVRAAYVSGMGIVNKVLTLKLKVARSRLVERVSISGPGTVVAGKTGSFAAQVWPWNADQSVTWSIVSRSAGQQKASITKSGALKTVSGKSGTITIRAASTIDPNYRTDFTVQVTQDKPVKKMTLNQTAMTLEPWEYSYLWVTSVINTAEESIPADQFGVRWSSSNTKIATVDGDGCVTAVSKGTATITCTSLDGSGKTAKCRITVTQPVGYLWVDGQDKVSPGSSAKYKVWVYPENASNKKVQWSLENAPYGVSISSSGTVTVKKDAAEGKEFTVIATAADGSGVVATFTGMVARKCTSVSIEYAGGSGWERVTRNKKGQMTGLQLYSVQRVNGLEDGGNTDTSAVLRGITEGTSYSTVLWESSNPDVVDFEINEAGELIARAFSAGKAKVTCTSQDGSKKKASITVTVINPVSAMSIQSDAGTIMSSGAPVIAFGKSAGNKVTFADTYGVPGNQKVVWSVAVKEYDAQGNVLNNWTGWALRQKLVSISSTGKLTTKKGLGDLRTGGELRITVTATATDGSGAQASQDYYALPPTTVLRSESRNWYILSDGQEWGIFIQCDQWNAYGDMENCAFTVKSSNPKLVSVAGVECYNERENLYVIWLASGRTGAKGNATLTVKSGDGCKSLTLNIQVRQR